MKNDEKTIRNETKNTCKCITTIRQKIYLYYYCIARIRDKTGVHRLSFSIRILIELPQT